MKYTSGFTLIEIIIYLALFSLFIGGAIVSGYELMQSDQANQTQAHIEEEGMFVLDKIHWELADGSTPTQIKNTIGSDTDMTMQDVSLDQETTNGITFTNISFSVLARSPQGQMISQIFNSIYFPNQ